MNFLAAFQLCNFPAVKIFDKDHIQKQITSTGSDALGL